MTRWRGPRGMLIPVVFFSFATGLLLGWWGRGAGAPRPQARSGANATLNARGGTSEGRGALSRRRDGSSEPYESPPPPRQVPDAHPRAGGADTADAGSGATRRIASGDVTLRLALPIAGADVGALKGQFNDRREGGARGHEAVDFIAPRNTPVHAVSDGRIAKLFHSKPGGITIYQFDPGERYAFYYAHLERYADSLHEGQQVSRGEVIGYVGTTGNAPDDTPHLHFAIVELTPEKHWWEGMPLDPYPVFAGREPR